MDLKQDRKQMNNHLTNANLVPSMFESEQLWSSKISAAFKYAFVSKKNWIWWQNMALVGYLARQTYLMYVATIKATISLCHMIMMCDEIKSKCGC